MKEDYLRYEREFLSPYACKSQNSLGRVKQIEPCPLRTEFQRDRDRIIHCKAFRRLKHKTQVFLSPHGDHYRTRLTHTLDVTQIARTISRALLLNEDLTEAIGLGHDLGHTPFGHMGERILASKSGHFLHNEHSLRVIECLENDGEGLNLTAEVRDGILHHKSNGTPSTLEGKVVSLADRIAYLNHDIDDAIREGVLTYDRIPEHINEFLGISRGKMIDSLVGDIVKQSYGKAYVKQSEAYKDIMTELRTFMFKEVYGREATVHEEARAGVILSKLYDYYISHPELLKGRAEETIQTKVVDYIAGMTDSFAENKYNELFKKEN